MKLSALILLTGASAVSAFVPSASSSRAMTTLAAARPDSSAAIQEALEASKKFGATSPEARVAWEIVEEMDSSDNR